MVFLALTPQGVAVDKTVLIIFFSGRRALSLEVGSVILMSSIFHHTSSVIDEPRLCMRDVWDLPWQYIIAARRNDYFAALCTQRIYYDDCMDSV